MAKQRVRIYALLTLWTLTSLTGQSVAGPEHGATTRSQHGASTTLIRDSMRDLRAKIRNMKVTYAEVMDSLSSPDFQHNDYATVVYLGESGFSVDRMYYRLQTVAGGKGSFETRPPSVFLSRSEFLKWWPHQRLAVRRVPDSQMFRRFFDNEHYFQALGLWASPFAEPEPDRAWLPRVLDGHPYALVRTDECVDGAPCWKLVWPGHDTLWLDPRKRFMLRKRLWCRPATREQGAFSMLYNLKEYREIQPGLWFPRFVQATRSYSRDGLEDARPCIIYQLLIRDIQVNTAKADVLPPSLSPGTLILDETGNEETFLAGGTDLLDQAADDIRGRLLFVQAPQGRFPAMLFFLAGFAGLAIAVGFVRLRADRRLREFCWR